MIKRIPLPIAGLMLALAATGNLIQTYSGQLRLVFGAVAALIGILLIIKSAMYPKLLLEDLKNPIMASVAPTFSMACMLLSAYVKPFLPSVGIFMWCIGFILHCMMIVLFTVRFVLKFDIKKVFPSYFIVYVGLAVASITASGFGMQKLGQAVFWFSFICYLILFLAVAYRVIKIKGIPEPAKPLNIIFAAPASLCLAGYLSVFDAKNMMLVCLLAVLSLSMYILALIQLPKMLKLKFYPSFSAFTFPMVISAVAMKMTDGFLTKTADSPAILKYIVILQTIIAVVLVLYVLYKYIIELANIKPSVKNAN